MEAIDPNDVETWPVAKNLTRDAAMAGHQAALDLLRDDSVMDTSTLNFRGGMELVRRGCDDTEHRREVFEYTFFMTIFRSLH